MMLILTLGGLGFWLLGWFCSTYFGWTRGQLDRGFIYGMLLGFGGMLVVLFFPNKRKGVRLTAQARRDAASLELTRRAVAAQEEQVRLLRELLGHTPPGQVDQAPPAAAEKPTLEDFVPDNLRTARTARQSSK